MVGKEWRLVAAAAAAAAAAGAGIWAASKVLSKWRLQAARQRWAAAAAAAAANGGGGGDKGPEDIVVLHMYPRASTSISLSPFVAKLEAFLRVANIKYIVDYSFPNSPETGKSPWITLDGQEIADSQVIVETLAKKFGKDFR